MDKKPKIKIFVAHHKPGYIYEDDIYVPIQVGKKNSEIDLGIIGDDTGDNISEKNSNYAELTAQYWVWKNYDLSDVDYVGFCHYRRYMTYRYRPNIFNYIFAKNFYTPTENVNKYLWKLYAFKEHHCLMKFNEKKLLKNSLRMKDFIKNNQFDVYVPRKNLHMKTKLLSMLGIKRKEKNLSCFGNTSCCNLLLEECIKLFYKMYPEQEQIEKKLKKEFEKYTPLHRHIFIMKKELFIQYMEWMFNYLFEVEKTIKEKNLDITTHRAGKYDGRFMGIFSEPLINYRLAHMKETKGIRVSYEANILMFTDYYFNF